MTSLSQALKGVKLTPEADLEPAFVALCKSITAKRAKTVIDHILRYGAITTEDLRDTYGYDHPPRAIRDVHENGIPILTHRIRSAQSGRNIAAYTFGSTADIKNGRIGGRKAFPKDFKNQLVALYGSRDAVTGERLEERYLQIDHRIPYQVGGETADRDPKDYMLLDASSQRAKSWSCEQCENFRKTHDPNTCRSCFWAFPETYTHIAGKQQRRLDVIWSGDEVAEFDRAVRDAELSGLNLRLLIKDSLKGK